MFGLQWCLRLKNRAEMPPKRCYDAARLGEAAEEAAKRYQTLFGSGLVCEYDGVVGGGSLTRTATVQFSWRVGGSEENTVQLRCDNACAQGIPLPDQMQSLLRRKHLDQAAAKATRVAQRSFGKGAVTCKYVAGPESDKLKHTSKVRFSWRVVVGEFEETHLAIVRCDHACAQGVPCPTELKEAYCRRRLEELVELSVTEARKSCGVGPNLACRSLCRTSLAYAYVWLHISGVQCLTS